MALDRDRVAPLFKKLDRQLGKLSSKSKAKGVHQFRTSARRLETILGELIADQDRNQRKLLKLVTKLRRRAGKIRDFDVQMAAVRSLRVSEQPSLKNQLLQTMSEMRARREERFLDLLDKETVRELRRRLKRAQDRFPQAASEPWPRAQALLSAFVSQNGIRNEKFLHRCRIQGKRIRYLAELTDHPQAQGVVEELKRMQDALGDWHDWLTLNSTVTKLLPENSNSPLCTAVRNIARSKYRDALLAVTNSRANLAQASPAEDQGAQPKPTASSQPALAQAVA